MTAEQAKQAKTQTDEGAVLSHRLFGVGRAAGIKTAGGCEQAAEKQLVSLNQKQQRVRQKARAAVRPAWQGFATARRGGRGWLRGIVHKYFCGPVRRYPHWEAGAGAGEKILG